MIESGSSSGGNPNRSEGLDSARNANASESVTHPHLALNLILIGLC